MLVNVQNNRQRANKCINVRVADNGSSNTYLLILYIYTHKMYTDLLAKLTSTLHSNCNYNYS